MKLFWIDTSNLISSNEHAALRFGIGVTASNFNDAVEVLRSYLSSYSLSTTDTPNMRELSSLEELPHAMIKANVGNHLIRGVWFPAN
jgi:hypothetical protein